MSSEERRRRLAELLREEALLQGDFELSAGGEASVYVDVKQVSLTGRGADLLGRELWRLAHSAAPDLEAIGGLTLGADPLITAATLAAHHDDHALSGIIVRKEEKGHGTGRFVEAPDALSDGARVVALDDVVTTGGSTLRAIEKMRQQGFTIEHAVCVVDREAGGRENLADAGVELHALFELSELVG